MIWTSEEKRALIRLARMGLSWPQIGDIMRPGVESRSHCCSNAFRRFGTGTDRAMRREVLKRHGLVYPKERARPRKIFEPPLPPPLAPEPFSGNCFAV